MRELHFHKTGRGQLYVCVVGDLRFQVYRVAPAAPFEVWHAAVYRRSSIGLKPLDEAPPLRSKAEAIDWCARQHEAIRKAEADKRSGAL